MSQIYGKHIDLLDDGDVYLQSSFKEKDCISGYNHCFEAKAIAIVRGNWADNLGVPEGTPVKGTLIVCYDQEGDPMDTPWEYYDFDDDFEVVEN